MCGRHSQFYTWEDIHAFSQPLTLSGPPSNLEPRYNISPTQQVGVLLPRDDGSLGYERMRWWLVPGWWRKSLREVPTTFNARAEGLEKSGMFRDALARRRCIIPSSGFYEWTGPKTARLPWYITAADGELLGFAGLWDRWINPETGEEIRSCTIITTGASQWMLAIHDRMPAILDREARVRWLTEGGTDLLRPAAEDALRAWRVDPAMNSSRYEAPEAARPLSEFPCG